MVEIRARATLRVLREDLQDGWEDPAPQRSLAEGRLADLLPISELRHPLLRKALEMFGNDQSAEVQPETIRCSGNMRLGEVRAGQWRAGVWTDSTSGVRWVCCAGLAKSEHHGHDDFYVELEKKISTNPDELFPTSLDRDLLKREVAGRRILDWELKLQSGCRDLLRSVIDEGLAEGSIPHPLGRGSIGRVCIERPADPSLSGEEFHVEISLDSKYRASDIGWTATLRILISVSPPHQQWDRTGDLFVTLEEQGHAEVQADLLDEHAARGELVHGEPGRVSHYIHRRHSVAHAVEGLASRALCGVFFVPIQDHEGLLQCPRCTEVYERKRQ